MLGRLTASLESGPRRWIRRVWGYGNISTRQKWLSVWPHLSRLPAEGLRLLDAGCGAGQWTLELAAQRPGWQVTGLDRDEKAVKEAFAGCARLGLGNATFECSDFLSFAPGKRFDVVLSVLSAHYLVEAGEGARLFRTFRTWLTPDGRLVLLGPRREGEAPFVSWLPRQDWHKVFSQDELVDLCVEAGLDVEVLRGSVGRLGTVAKQLDFLSNGGGGLLPVWRYFLQWGLSALDARVHGHRSPRSLMWLLVATARSSRVASG